MLVRMTQELKRLYSNLGLPESILNSVASVATVGMSSDADDAALSARAGEDSIREMLRSFQSHADKIRSDAKKVEPKKNKDDDESDDVPSWFKSYEERQEKTQNELLEKIKVLEGAASAKDFESLVGRIGKDLGLNDAMLDLCKAGLSSDMDETAVRDKLGAVKKTFIENGVHFEERLSSQSAAARDQAELDAARAWAKENVVKTNE